MQTLAYTSLERREDLGIIFFRWLEPASTGQFISGYTQILEATDFRKIGSWLFDTRRRGPATPEAEAWYFGTYLPLLKSQLTRKLRIAVLHTPAHYIHLRDVIGFDTFTRHTAGSLIEMGFFDSEQNAVNWLRAEQKNAV